MVTQLVVLVVAVVFVFGFIYRRTRILAGLAVVMLLVVILLSSLKPVHSRARPSARTAACRDSLKSIMQALHSYHDTYRCFPPAYVADYEGRATHSWRVLILPYLDRSDLYERYCFDEPWDGPNNCSIADGMHFEFRCFSERSGNALNTNYVLIAGDGTAWAEGRTPEIADSADGPSDTIVVVEVANSGIHWMEPRDLTIDQAMRGINAPTGMCISSQHALDGREDKPESAHVAFLDGTVVNLKNDFPLDQLRKLLTHQGGEAVERPR